MQFSYRINRVRSPRGVLNPVFATRLKHSSPRPVCVLRTGRQTAGHSASNGIKFFLFTAAVLLSSAISVHAADTTPPTTPGAPSVLTSGLGYGQVSISWSLSSDNVGVTGYYIYRNGAQFAEVSAPPFKDSGLSPQMVYIYTVAAHDAAGNISNQSAQAVVTITADTTPPTVPTGLSATETYRPPQITLSWSASTDDMGSVSYYVSRDGQRIRTSSAITGTSYTDNNVSAGTAYSYSVTAYDTAGNTSAQSVPLSVTIFIDNEPPSAPSALSATPASSSTVILSWASSTDNVGVIGYYIYRGGSQVASVSSSLTSYVDSGLSYSTYNYTVAAYDFAGNVSIMSPSANATLISDPYAPYAPTWISANASSSSKVNLSWNSPYDNIGVIGFRIYRGGTLIANVSSTVNPVNSYSDTNLTASTTYIYTLTAYDLSGNVSSSSLPMSVSTPAAGTAQPAQTGTAISTAVSATSTANSTAGTVQAGQAITYQLSRGSRNNQVRPLQNILIKLGYLSAFSNTGYFGPATEKAIQKFQCDNGIVCNSSAAGWGVVDGKTRDLLNSISGVGNQNVSSTTQLTAQIQALQAILNSLLLQIQLHR